MRSENTKIGDFKSLIIDINLPIQINPLGFGISVELIKPTETSLNLTFDPTNRLLLDHAIEIYLIENIFEVAKLLLVLKTKLEI